MGKCPAPCDGSISMDQYRVLVELSLKVLLDPADYVREQERRMGQAAAELRFEIAARIKTYVEQLSQLGRGPFGSPGRWSGCSFCRCSVGRASARRKCF